MILAVLQVAWSVTAGTLTPVNDSQARYTAPLNASGTVTVTATASGKVGKSTVTFAAADIIGGIPFGPYAGQDAGYPPPFTLSMDGYSSGTIVTLLDQARQKGQHLILALTGGDHANYLTNGVFDRAKWQAKLETFNTAIIRNSISAAVQDGTILGASVMDEPNVSGLGDGNTWGPPGTMTKARVDSLCGAVQLMFLSLNAGVVHNHDTFEPDKSYKVCQFLVDQYSDRKGDVTVFRNAGLALGARDHHAILFAVNLLNGGVQDRDGTWSCDGAGQGGLGQRSPNCAMTAAQVKQWGLLLGSAGCGFTMWRYEGTFMAVAANQTSFKAVADSLGKLPAKGCKRTG